MSLAVLGAVLIIPACRSASTQAPLAFGVSPELPAYQLGSPMPLTLTLTNNSKKTVTVNARLAVDDAGTPAAFHEVELQIHNPAGGQAQFGLDIRRGFPAPKDFVTLKPGGSVTATVDINAYYVIDQPGHYSLTGVYENRQPGPVDPSQPSPSPTNLGAVQGKISSKTVTFTVS